MNEEYRYISPLSYFLIGKKGATKELLEQTLLQMNVQFQDFFKNLKTTHHYPLVYAIKKYVDKPDYEYELYYYMYNPYRYSPLHILVDSNKYIDCNIPRIITTKKCYQDKKFIIASIDMNDAFFKGSEKVQFYFGITYNSKMEMQDVENIRYIDNKPYPFYCVIEHEDGLIEKTNIYGNAEIVCDSYNKKYCNENTIVFFTHKKGSIKGYYYEMITYEAFLRFLEDFSYDREFIEFCTTNYNHDMYFSVGYDEKDGKRLRSAIYGIFA